MENNETTPTETVNFATKIKNKVRTLPLKKIAIAAAVTAAVVIVASNKDKLCGPSYEIEIDEVTPDGELHVQMTPITD